MTESPAPPSTFEQWLDALIEAAPADRRMLAIQGSDAGFALRRVRCERHKTSLNWLSAHAHIDRTEASHRLQHGASARLHQPGDLVAMLDPTKTDTCRFCHEPIVWASTLSGSKMPVDAEPNPAGNVVLSTDPDPNADRPLAVVLHTEFERTTVPADSIHTSHMQTCTSRPKSTGSKSTGRTSR